MPLTCPVRTLCGHGVFLAVLSMLWLEHDEGITHEGGFLRAAIAEAQRGPSEGVIPI